VRRRKREGERGGRKEEGEEGKHGKEHEVRRRWWDISRVTYKRT